MDLHAARVLVTGGTSGVGTALVDVLVASEAFVVTCGRDRTRCRELRSLYPDVHVVEIDLAERGSGRRLVNEAIRVMGGLDVVVNNAGIQILDQYAPSISDGFEDRISRELAVNLASPMEITAAAMPSLVASKAAAIVYVTSGLAVFPKKTAPVYCATKSGLRTFAATVRYQTEEVAPHVTVIDAVLPLVDTPMTAGRGTPSEKISPQEAATRIVHAIVNSKSIVYIGKARALPWLVRMAPSVGRRALRNG